MWKMLTMLFSCGISQAKRKEEGHRSTRLWRHQKEKAVPGFQARPLLLVRRVMNTRLASISITGRDQNLQEHQTLPLMLGISFSQYPLVSLLYNLYGNDCSIFIVTGKMRGRIQQRRNCCLFTNALNNSTSIFDKGCARDFPYRCLLSWHSSGKPIADV